MRYSLSRATLYNLASYLYLLFATLATTPSLIRALTLPVFGEYVLALALLSLLTSLDLGLSRSVVFHLARTTSPLRQMQYISASFTLHAGLGGLYGLGVSFLTSPALGLLIFLTYLLGHFQAVPESSGRFGLVNLRAFLLGTSNTFGALLLARSGASLNHVLALLSLTTLFTLFIFALATPHPRLRVPERSFLSSLLSYGLRVQFGKFVNAMSAQYPKFLLATDPLGLTVFSLASSLVAKGVGAVTQFAIAYFPAGSRTPRSPMISHYYVRAQVLLFVLGLLALLLHQFYGLPVLTWWLADPALATQLNSFLHLYRYYGFLLLFTPLASTVVDSANRPGLSSLYAALALLLELAVVLSLLKSLGITVFALGPLLSLVVMVPVLLTTTQRILRTGGN